MSPWVGSFEDVGIPRTHSESFLAAAESSGCVILTRTPGVACTMLLGDGYDGKCFHIKAKSCDWGPMAGFVCLDPILSKKGIKGALDNLREHKKSLTMGYEGRAASVTQIIISHARVGWLMENEYIVPDNPRAPALTGTIVIERHRGVPADIGLIIHGIPWLLYRQPQGWALFYDRSRTYNLHPPLVPPMNRSIEGLRRLFVEFQRLFFRAYVPERPMGDADASRVWHQYRDLERDFMEIHRRIGDAGVRNFQGISYEPVLALVNPHPPYRQRGLAYKNATTGDYDLFGVWPVHDAPRTEDQRRIRKIGREDPFVGNITNRVFEVAQLINSEIARRTRGNVVPNRVFHSDEAGNPFAPDLSFPVAAFLPRRHQNRMGRIDDLQGLRQCILSHAREYRLYINAAWLGALGLPRNTFSWD